MTSTDAPRARGYMAPDGAPKLIEVKPLSFCEDCGKGKWSNKNVPPEWKCQCLPKEKE